MAELFFTVDQVDSTLLKLISRTERDRLNLESISIYNFENKLIYTNSESIRISNKLGITHDILNLIRIENRKKFNYREFELLGLNYKFRKKNYVIIAGAIDIYGNSQMDNLRVILFILFFCILGVVAAAGWIYSGKALSPISQVVNEVEGISTKNLDARLKALPNKDEIGRLVVTFNRLLQRVEDAFNLQRIFVAGASHELKNPLSAITSQLQVSLLKDRSPEEYRDTIQSVLDDIKKLNQITIQLMELARLNHDYTSIALEPVRIDEILWEACQNLARKNPKFKIEQSIASLPENENELVLLGNSALLSTAFENLAENACKFSANQSVLVRLVYENNQLNVHFIDTGSGISGKELSLIYEPFYRSSSSTGIRGTGLGLALVEKIIEIHKGKIQIESTQGVGTQVVLSFSPKF